MKIWLALLLICSSLYATFDPILNKEWHQQNPGDVRKRIDKRRNQIDMILLNSNKIDWKNDEKTLKYKCLSFFYKEVLVMGSKYSRSAVLFGIQLNFLNLLIVQA